MVCVERLKRRLGSCLRSFNRIAAHVVICSSFQLSPWRFYEYGVAIRHRKCFDVAIVTESVNLLTIAPLHLCCCNFHGMCPHFGKDGRYKASYLGYMPQTCCCNNADLRSISYLANWKFAWIVKRTLSNTSNNAQEHSQWDRVRATLDDTRTPLGSWCTVPTVFFC